MSGIDRNDIQTLNDVIGLLTFLEENGDLGSTDLNRLRRAIRKLMHVKERMKYVARSNPCGASTPRALQRRVGGTRSRARMAKRNPSLVVYNPPDLAVRRMTREEHVVGIIGQNVHRIEYEHADDGNMYFHDFEPGVKMIALEHGGDREILLTSDKPLWEDFE
jgi:hypothetical protein